jgi:hypothetical protein
VLNSQGQPQGQINALRVGATGNLYLLIDQKDGVRLLETNPTATTVLASAYIGAKFDVGLAMALDPAGNVYVTGTTTSGALTATEYATCSLLPSSVTLSGAAQNAVATLNTVTEVSSNSRMQCPAAADAAWAGRRSACSSLHWSSPGRRAARGTRRGGGMGRLRGPSSRPSCLLSASGCGGSSVNSNLRFSPAGSYQYQVSASSVSGAVQITQTVTLNLTVQ